MQGRLFPLALLVLCLAACQSPAATRAITTISPTDQPPKAARLESTYTPSPDPLARCLVETGSPAGTVYVRRGPGMAFPVVGYATQGELLELTGEKDPAGWAEIRQNGRLIGWFFVDRWCKKGN